jgi:membrane protease YdiL (CAAX protease family)
LAAQPAALTIAVSFTESVKPHLTVLRNDYSGAPEFVLAAVLENRDARKLARVRRKWSYRPMPWDFWLIFIFLGVVIPWRGHARLQKLLAKPHVSTMEKLALYGSTIAFQWVIVAVVAWRAIVRGMTPEQLGLVSHDVNKIVIVALIGGAMVGVLHWLNLRRIARLHVPAVDGMRAIAERILPQSLVELLPYSALAMTAGLCEEFLYRGFVMGVLLRLGWRGWLVVMVSSILFGFAHAYQGRSGVIGTMVLGLLFAVVRLAYDSLVPVIVWHAVVDLVAGIAGPRYLLTQSDTEIKAV